MSLRGRLRPPVVIAHHGVGAVDDGADPHLLIVEPRNLEDQLDALQRRGYRFITAAQHLDEGGADTPPPPQTAVLTFDDGWLDALTTVVPILQRRGIAATFYVCPGWLGGRHPLVQGEANRLLSADDVKALHRSGMDVASHSMEHRDLRTLSPDELLDDVAGSKAAVEHLLDLPCRTFAYPYGHYDDNVVKAVDEAGYDLAFAWSPGPWKPLAAPRLPGPPRHGGRRLVLKMFGIRRPAR